MRKITTLLLLIMSMTLTAQVTNKGEPESFKQDIRKGELAPIVMPSFDLAALLEEDKRESEGIRTKPYRFGYDFDVNYNTFNSGRWSDVKGGKIWQIRFKSEGALTMNFMFDVFHLPEGARLYFYNIDKTELLGAYTSSENIEDGHKLGTWIVPGDDVIAEAFIPEKEEGKARLNIEKVIHGYRGFDAPQLKLNESGACNVDVNCAPGGTISWDTNRNNYRNAVARIIINGSGLCTGTLMNNVKEDGTPYFLTAHHCLGVGNTDGVSGTFNGTGWTFGFQWFTNTPDCATNANTVGPNSPTNVISGGTLRANKFGSDVALFELNQAIPAGWNLYYAGWDNTNATPTTQLGIHHPSGDIMKLARNDQSATSQNVTISGQTADTWVIADWDYGVTEGGSSGSSLMDQNGRVIGQLFGGGAACSGTTDNGAPDYYGRFGTSWNTGTAANTRLRDWLDPDNTSPTTLDGEYYNQLSVSDFEVSTSGLFIHPNPTRDRLNIVMKDQTEAMTFVLYNSIGQVLQKGSIVPEQNNTLSLAKYNAGIYFIKISDKSGDQSLTRRIIVR